MKVEPMETIEQYDSDEPEVIDLTEVKKVEAAAFIKEIKRRGYKGPELTPENCYRLGAEAACKGEISAPSPLEAGLAEQVKKEVCMQDDSDFLKFLRISSNILEMFGFACQTCIEFDEGDGDIIDSDACVSEDEEEDSEVDAETEMCDDTLEIAKVLGLLDPEIHVVSAAIAATAQEKLDLKCLTKGMA